MNVTEPICVLVLAEGLVIVPMFLFKPNDIAVRIGIGMQSKMLK
jgi:hypothetical protein